MASLSSQNTPKPTYGTTPRRLSFFGARSRLTQGGMCQLLKIMAVVALTVFCFTSYIKQSESLGAMSWRSAATASGRSLWPRVMLLGDSLTQRSFTFDGGWGALLAASLSRQCDVISRGFSGYNSRQWRSLVRQLPVASLQGEVAFLWLGANDAAHTDAQGVPVPEFKDNLKDIVTYLKEKSIISDVILMTPPAANEQAMPSHIKEGRSGVLTLKYAVACREVASELKLPCVDVHTAFINQDNWHSLLSDGLHLSRSGASLVHSLVLPTVQQHVRKHMPANMTGQEDVIMPLWDSTLNEYPNKSVENWLKEHPVGGGH